MCIVLYLRVKLFVRMNMFYYGMNGMILQIYRKCDADSHMLSIIRSKIMMK